jgi:hypothetical protein
MVASDYCPLIFHLDCLNPPHFQFSIRLSQFSTKPKEWAQLQFITKGVSMASRADYLFPPSYLSLLFKNVQQATTFSIVCHHSG